MAQAEFALNIDLKTLVQAMGQLQSVSKTLADIQKRMQEAQEDYARENIGNFTRRIEGLKRAMERISESFKNTKMGKAFNRFKSDLATAGHLIKKGIVEPFQKAYKTIRNMGIAMLGVASAAIYFSRGASEKETAARQAGYSGSREARIAEFAGEWSGRKLDLAGFNEMLQSPTEGYSQLAAFDIDKNEIRKIAAEKGLTAAFLEVGDRVQRGVDAGKWRQGKNGFYGAQFEAMQSLFGIGSQGDAISMFGNKGHGSYTQWKKGIGIGNSKLSEAAYGGMIKVDQAAAELALSFELLKNRAMQEFAPILTDLMGEAEQGMKGLHKWISSPEGKEAIKGFMENIKTAAQLLKEVFIAGLVGVAKLLRFLPGVNLGPGISKMLEEYDKANKGNHIFGIAGPLADALDFRAERIENDKKGAATTLGYYKTHYDAIKTGKANAADLPVDYRRDMYEALQDSIEADYKKAVSSFGKHRMEGRLDGESDAATRRRQLKELQVLLRDVTVKAVVVDKTSNGIKVAEQIQSMSN